MPQGRSGEIGRP